MSFVTLLPPKEVLGLPVSSSRVRKELLAGAVDVAVQLLGRPHRIAGIVGRGEQRGAAIGFPTANLEGVTTLVWMYTEANVKAESFIPYAGAFMGGTRGSNKSLSVTLVADKVTGYTFSGGGSETRQMTQGVPKN